MSKEDKNGNNFKNKICADSCKTDCDFKNNNEENKNIDNIEESIEEEKVIKMEKDMKTESAIETETGTETEKVTDNQKLIDELQKKTEECEKYFQMLQRTAAEFDNYKKRTIKEKEALYTDAKIDVITAFIPIVDNLERALDSFSNEVTLEKLEEGIELVFKQMKEVMKNLGVEQIKAVGEKFDPNFHDAMMHIEDDNYGENEIVEEFQKGYMLKDKVIRYSMVKVAN